MLKRFFTFILLLFAALQFSTLQAQGLNLNGNGARAAGMGYAFTGLADDASAISWNTAGLTQLYSMEATVVGRFSAGSYDITNSFGGASPDISTNAKFQLNFASFIIPFTVGNFNIVGGIAYRNIYDFNETLNMAFPEGDVERKQVGSVNAITPSIAIQLSNSFSVGVAYNYNFGKYQYSENGDLDEYTDSRYSGSSFDIGVLFRPNSKFSIGGNMNMPNTLKESYESFEDYEEETKIPFFWSVGAAFKATDQFTISFDYHARPWSNSEDFESEELATDLNSYHVGLEYMIVTQSVVIPLRGGFYTKPLFVWDKDNNQVTDNVFTLGVGVMVGDFIVDAAFEFESSSYDGYYTDYNGYSVLAAIEKNTVRTTLGATFHFGE